MAKQTSAVCWAAKISWVVTALASINIGMALFNFNFFQTNFFMMNLTALAPLIIGLIGLSGLFSLVTFAMHCSSGCKSCKL